ncbi:molybdate ABC transporter substrate-binding protein [Aliikangiella coralliicola]|uniref:Molybdate ABC transporter substrate-binding protein n=2 Tax=Aliikangiella coralliicola TaxID=2592383 RepID=A0A545UCN6_9GAMM|nr:molybdate ABC transporter substrate-binding protein [Aliikangiella coralliicola]
MLLVGILGYSPALRGGSADDGVSINRVAINNETIDNEAINVAVAANFYAPLKVISNKFEKQSGRKVRLIPGSSGKIFAQIKNGAPFDVFLSADQHKPAALEQAGLVVKGSRFTYAQGELVLWSNQAGLSFNGAKTIQSNVVKKLALANPKLAPYGLAAKQVLDSLNLYESVKNKLVYGENIAQTYQFVASGNAQVGFLALSQVIGMSESGEAKHRSGSFWRVPGELHQPIFQDAVILKRAKANSTASEFLKFLRTTRATHIIHAYGYKAMQTNSAQPVHHLMKRDKVKNNNEGVY